MLAIMGIIMDPNVDHPEALTDEDQVEDHGMFSTIVACPTVKYSQAQLVTYTVLFLDS